jgi:glucokinase-like ROK family protein
MSSGTLLFAPNLKWVDVPLRQMLAEEFDLPIYVANEANMATLGESYFGKGRDHNLLLYVSSGVGIGGGIVSNGRLLTGGAGFTGEVGHMTIDPDGPHCNCGNQGCWETLASQQALFRRIRDALQAGQSSLLTEATQGDLSRLTVQRVTCAAQSGDLVACNALEETGYWLGVGLANLMNVLNPDCVVFGGPLSLAEKYLLPVIKRVVAERVLPHNRQHPDILISVHVADACVMGGAAMVHDEVLTHPARWLL